MAQQQPTNPRSRRYHVTSAGEIRHDGRIYRKGDTLDLNAAAAKALKAFIAPGEAPPKPEEINARKAGRYRALNVIYHDSAKRNGRPYQAGELLELSAEDARRLGTHVEAVA